MNKEYSSTNLNYKARILIIDNENIIEKNNFERKYIIKEISSKENNSILNFLDKDFLPDLIFLNINIAKKNNYTLCKTLRKIQVLQYTPIIIISSENNNNQQYREKVFKHKINEYLVAPISRKELSLKIETYLTLSFSAKQLMANDNNLLDTCKKQQDLILKNNAQDNYISLINGIIHNLRGPLAVVLGNLDLIHLLAQNMLNDDKNNKNLKNILAFTDRSSNSCNDLNKMINSIAIKNRNKNDGIDKILNLNDIIEQELNFLGANLYFKNEVTKNIDITTEELMIRVKPCDISQTIQIFINNSLDAISKEGKPKINLSTKRVKNKAVLEIEDNRTGIETSELDKGFNPFDTTKTNISEKREQKILGNGLSFYYAQQILKSYKGKIKVSSKSNKDTKLTITIPLEE